MISVKEDNKIHVSWAEIDYLTDRVAKQVVNNYPEINSVYGIARGGLIPATMLSHKLDIPYSSQLSINTLIVDDICDSGVTLKKWKGYKTAVLFHKPHTACMTPTIHGNIHTGNEWIIYPWERKDSQTKQDYLLDK